MAFRSWARQHEVSLLIFILLVAGLLRLYRLSNPLLDWHAWRQADTASVTREYLKQGLDILQPKFLDISSTPSGTDNPIGYRMVEFPVLNLLTVSALKIAPGLPLEQTSRTVSVVLSIMATGCLYGLVRSLSGPRVAVLTAVVFAVLPFSVYYGRVVLPEPALLAAILASLLGFRLWLTSSKWWWYVIAFISLTLSYLLKPYALFFAPAFVALAWLQWQWRALAKPLLWVLALVPVAPLLWWRNWITQYPEGIPGSSWLFNGNEIRFKPAWFRWIFFERMVRLILGSVGSIPILANVLGKLTPDLLVYGAWWLGMLAYVSILATGNVQHDYYQSLLTPIIAITVGRGLLVLYEVFVGNFKPHWVQIGMFGSVLLIIALYSTTFLLNLQATGYFPELITHDIAFLIAGSLIVVSIVLLARYKRLSYLFASSLLLLLSLTAVNRSWQYVSGYFNVNHWEFVRAGQAVQQHSPPDALIIAPWFGDTQLLFQTDRRGWPIGGSIDDKIAKGADYYLAINRDDEYDQLAKKYAIVTQTPEFSLFDLHSSATASAAPTTESP